MIRRNLLLAALVAAAVSFAGDRAQAAFSITATESDNAPTGLGLTFTTNPLTNAPVPTPTGGISYNFLNINYAGSTFTGSGQIMISGTFTVNNNGTTGTANYSETLMYNVTNGFGNLSMVTSSIDPTAAGVFFGPVTFTAPTLGGNVASQGNLSTNVSAVPEPASMSLLGLGLGAAGLVARRRRRAA